MAMHRDAVTATALKRAIETRDGPALSDFYADDALLRIVDRNNPPSRPHELRGRDEIGRFWTDVCSRDMTHRVDMSVSEGDHLALTEACSYPDGTQVLCMATIGIKGGKIVEQTMVQAWDE
jgi:ketosteroid isomerase-like protein